MGNRTIVNSYPHIHNYPTYINFNYTCIYAEVYYCTVIFTHLYADNTGALFRILQHTCVPGMRN